MPTNFNHARPQVYFTAEFMKNHIFVGSSGQKKKAENVFLRRGKSISTVLCLTRMELVQLAGEVHRNQSECGRNPAKLFTSQRAYDFWSRGGAKAKDKQRATLHNGRFKYAMRLVQGGIYAMCHFDGLPDRTA